MPKHRMLPARHGTGRAAAAAAAGVLAIAAIVAFFPVVDNGFVNWDDPAVLVNNRHLRESGVMRWAFSTTLIGHYQPIAWLAWWTAATVFGVRPAPLHALSLAGHLVNAALVYMLVRRLAADVSVRPLSRDGAAFAGALMFALHPMSVEVVAWASAFPYVLSLTALLVAVLAYVERRPFVTLACYAVSLLTRASIGFPALLIAIDVYPLRRQRNSSVARLSAEKAPFIALAAAAAAAEWYARDVSSLSEVDVGARATMAVTAPFVYLAQFVWPVRLSPLRPVAITPTLMWTPLLLGVAGFAAISIAAWRQRHRVPAAAAAWLAFLALLAPVAGFAASGLQATADRYMYAPAVILCAAGGLAFARMVGAGARAAAFATATAMAIAIALGVLTFRQTLYWRDSITLWTRAAELDQHNDIATYNLAVALGDAGRTDEAIARYRETLALVPDHDLARRNMAVLEAARAEQEGNRLAAAARFDEAIDSYARALALDATRVHARAARGMALVSRGRYSEAAADLRQALDAGHADPEVPGALAFALVQTGGSAQAAAVLARAVAQHPDNVNLKHNLARLLATAADPQVRDGARALRLAREVCEQTGERDPRALDTLAAAYAANGRRADARNALTRALARAREIGDTQMAAEIASHAAAYGR